MTEPLYQFYDNKECETAGGREQGQGKAQLGAGQGNGQLEAGAGERKLGAGAKEGTLEKVEGASRSRSLGRGI